MRERTALDSILDAVGHTPMVELTRLGRGLPGRIFGKAEFLNPGASMKDRIGLQILDDAEGAGYLLPGMAVVEMTSGNTGISLAMACAVKGYPFIAVMSKGNSPERIRMLKALGARVELVPQARGHDPGQVTGEDLALVEKRTRELVVELGAFWADQFHNPGNYVAHSMSTGQEIWEQMQGRVDVFLHVVGTAGTFRGVSRALKEKDQRVRCLAVEPALAPILAGEEVQDQRHKLQGSSYAMVPPLWDSTCCDGYLKVTDEEAIEASRRLARTEGILTGYTAGGNVAAALQVAAASEPEARIVTLLCDSGMKYLSTDLFPL